jgi:hypothetical protein
LVVALERLLVAVDALDHHGVLGAAAGAGCGVRECRHGGGLLESLAAGAPQVQVEGPGDDRVVDVGADPDLQVGVELGCHRGVLCGRGVGVGGVGAVLVVVLLV